MSLAIGDTAPPFSLPTTEGDTVSLAGLAESDAVAVVFSCNHCPYAQAWEDRVNEVAREYAGRGVALVAINANDAAKYPADSFDAMVDRAREKGFVFPYAYDESQEVARAYGAERTPEVFLFDGDRRLVYHGAVDDAADPGAVKVRYLRDAVEAVLAGETPPRAETPPVGCTVKWRPSR
jgi:peroxiredoxin